MHVYFDVANPFIGRQELITLLKRYGVTRASFLKPSDYASFIGEIALLSR